MNSQNSYIIFMWRVMYKPKEYYLKIGGNEQGASIYQHSLNFLSVYEVIHYFISTIIMILLSLEFVSVCLHICCRIARKRNLSGGSRI